MQAKVPSPRRGTALAALLLSCLGVATSSPVCSSGIDGDDVDTQQCFGWCNPITADAHCQWCKCRGCAWCSGVLTTGYAASAVVGAASPAGGSDGTADCETAAAGESAVHDCQGFCTAAASEQHCPLCKCKACSFCRCQSEHEDDSAEEMCEPWCTSDYYSEHCGRCKCKACDFCKTGPPCASEVVGDVQYSTCEPFCDAAFRGQHCGMCKCKECDFCQAPLPEPACNSGVEGDVDHEACEAFCSAENKGEHCGLCKCRGCSFCSCASPHEGDSTVEECQPWCNGDFVSSHCDYCSCKGCRFCRVGGKACQSFYLTGDLDHEACEPFCNVQAKATHCGMCKCKQCGFCKAEERAALPAAGGAATCFSGLAHDSDSPKCESFCDAAHGREHCAQCKCKGCVFCGKVCDSGIAGDTEVAGCAAWCHLASPEAACPACGCQSCPFCTGDGNVFEEGVRAREREEETARASPHGCAPKDEQDTDVAQCGAHCSPANKAGQCGRCECKACDFCQGFEACESGRPGDTAWGACDDACDRPGDCELCGCRNCERCRAERSRPSPACRSGILGDTQTAECVLGLCLAEHKESHCQACRCQACSFCQAPPAVPPPSPPLAAERHTCESGRVGDGFESKCEPFCTSHAVPSTLVCDFCSCRACSRCREVKAGPAPVASSRPGEAGCPLALELNVLSFHREEKDSVLWDLSLRPSDWQPGALVSVDFGGHPSKVHIDADDVDAAELVALPPASGAYVYTFRMSAKPGLVRGFSFTAFTDRDSLTNPRPKLSCSHATGGPPPPSPAPPRPPPPPPPWLQNQCALGGRFSLGQVWSGGGSFRARVVMAVWRPNAQVTLDFRESAGQANLAGLAASNAEGATLQKSPYPGSIRVALGAAPGPGNSFSIIAHGGNVGHRPPQILCSLPGATAGPTAVEAAVIDASCAPLSPLYRVLNAWQGGFKAAVAIGRWQPGAQVVVSYGTFKPQLLSAWSATGSSAEDGSLAFTLGASADPEYNGLTFTAHGNADAASAPALRCTASAVAAATVQVPAAACGLGASFSLLPEGETPPEAAAAKGGPWRVRVRVHRWEPLARLDLTFSPAVSLSGADGARLLGGAPGDASSVHSLELGPHPDSLHGISVLARAPPAAGPPQLVRLTCRPPPRPSGPEDGAKVVAGAPEPPEGLVVETASCNHLDLRWLPSVDNGLRVTRYSVIYRREDSAPEDEDSLDVETTGATLGGLAGGTRYVLRVRPHNAKGAGQVSESLVALTDGGGAPLIAPVPPKPYRSLNCGQVALELPTLRAGCRGDGFLTVEGRSLVHADALDPGTRLKPHWTVLVGRTAGASTVLSGLDAYDAAEFRITAHNADGPGPPSDIVGPLLTDSDQVVTLDPPRALATSSASFALTWDELSGSCRGRMRWSVWVRREGVAGNNAVLGAVPGAGPGAVPGVGALAAEDGAGWEELASDVEGGGYEAFPLRCPPPGCAFRVHPIGLRGLNRPSAPSAPAASLPLPPPHLNAVRVELRLAKPQSWRDLSHLSVLAAAEIAAQLRIDSAHVEVREAYGRGQYLVIDLYGAAQAGGGTGEVTPARLLAEQLQAVLDGLRGSALGTAEVGRDLDVSYGVQLLLDDGRLTRVRVSEASRHSATRLPRAPLISPQATAAASFTLVVGVSLLAFFFSGTCLRQAVKVARLRSAQAGYGRVATALDAQDGATTGRVRPKRAAPGGRGTRPPPRGREGHTTLDLDE